MTWIKPSTGRTLLTILRLADEGKTITVRAIMRRLGYRSTHAIWPHIGELRKLGLVSYEEVGGKARPGSLRPRYRLEVRR